MIYCRNCENQVNGTCSNVKFIVTDEDYCSRAVRKKGVDPWDAVLEVAQNEIGYHETGYNINKYAEHFDKNHPEFYHGKMQKQAWCGIFVDWCFEMAYGFEEMKRMLYRPDTVCRSCGVRDAYNYFEKNEHLIHGKNPQPGMQVFFGQNYPWRTYDHTGIILAKIDDTHYDTIEGNYQNGVYLVHRNYSECTGYGLPNWDE